MRVDLKGPRQIIMNNYGEHLSIIIATFKNQGVITLK
jgi:hypothetical protein